MKEELSVKPGQSNPFSLKARIKSFRNEKPLNIEGFK